MARALPVLERRGFGQTLRRDAWWAPNVGPLVVFTAFLVYGTWAALQNANYEFGPYLSPFYSPLLARPAIWPGWLPFSPALLILPFPGLFRFTCYYYRGAYYKAFWADPPGCAVGEPRKSYLGERSFPLVLQNVHRYFLYFAILILFVLAYDAWKAFWFVDAATGTRHFGIGVGTVILVLNVVLLASYTFGCHAMRHLVGGVFDEVSRSRLRSLTYAISSTLNRAHMRWAWFSLFSVALADLYIRLCAMGVLTDLRLI